MNANWRLFALVLLVSVTPHLRGEGGAETNVGPASVGLQTIGINTRSGASANEGGEGSLTNRDSQPPLPGTQSGIVTDGLQLNFRNAPLNLVLDYLSDAAGFVINKEADVKGTVEIWCKDSVTKEEAVELLNAALKKNGYAVIRNGRLLTIVRLDTAKTADLEVVSGNDPEQVAKSDEIVTQIIPVRYASASQLANNLQILLPTSASLSINESANSLILVATKTDIRRMLRICNLVDNSLANVSAIRVFPLRYADSKQLATVIQQLFAPQSTQGGGNRQNQFAGAAFPGAFGGPGGGGPFGGAGGGGFPGGNLGGGGGAGSGGRSGSGGSSGNATALRVVATSDDYSNSLIVGAASELMTTIADMVRQIDCPVADITELRVFTLKNADPGELADQLAQLFPDDSRSGANRNQGQVQFAGGPAGAGGGPFGGGPFGSRGGGGGGQSSSSDRTKKMSQVLAVADSRTSSLLVSAASTLMPQIAQMIERLDASPARKEVVSVWELHNANVNDVNQVLQDLFNRNSTMRNNNNSRNSLLGDNNPLAARQTQQQQQSSQGFTSFGTSRSGAGGGSSGTGTGF